MNKLLYTTLKSAGAIAKRSAAGRPTHHVLIERDLDKLRVVATDGCELLLVDLPNEKGSHVRAVVDAPTCLKLAYMVRLGRALDLQPSEDPFPPYENIMPRGKRTGCGMLGIDPQRLSGASKVVADILLATGMYKYLPLPARMSLGGRLDPVELHAVLDAVTVRYVIMPMQM